MLIEKVLDERATVGDKNRNLSTSMLHVQKGTFLMGR